VARREPGDGPPLLPLLTTLLFALCGGLLASRFLSELEVPREGAGPVSGPYFSGLRKVG